MRYKYRMTSEGKAVELQGVHPGETPDGSWIVVEDRSIDDLPPVSTLNSPGYVEPEVVVGIPQWGVDLVAALGDAGVDTSKLPDYIKTEVESKVGKVGPIPANQVGEVTP